MRAPQLRNDRYRLLELVGHTGRRVMWRGLDRWANTQVILARAAGTGTDGADPGGVRALVAREVGVACAVRSAHLTPVTDLAVTPEGLWVVSEDPGRQAAHTMPAVLEYSPVAPLDIARWGCEVAGALASVHGAGLVHRDVHAGLVLVDENGAAHLTGLGATPTGRPDGADPPCHPAPEVRLGSAPSPAADVFAWASMIGTALAAAGVAHDGGGIWEMLGQARDPDPARRPDAATAGQRLHRAMTATPIAQPAPVAPVAERATEVVTVPPAPPHRPTRPATRPANRAPGHPLAPPPATVPRPRPPGNTAPPLGPPPGWPPAAPPPRPAGSRRTTILVLALVVVLALLAGLGVVGYRLIGSTLGTPAPPAAAPAPAPAKAPSSLLGDTRTADACSLLRTESVRHLGSPRFLADYITAGSCGIAIRLNPANPANPALVVLSARFAEAFPESPRETAQQVGELRVLRRAPEDGGCPRAIVLPDKLRVLIDANVVLGTSTTDLCALADIGTSTAAETLNAHAVTHRDVVEPPNALTRIDQCALFDQAVLAPVQGLNSNLRRPGLNGWSCRWGYSPTYPYAPQVDVAALYLAPGNERPISVGGRDARLRPNFLSSMPQSCTLDLYHRPYVTPDGRALREMLQITVYAGQQPNPDVACAQVTAIGNAVAPKLPPPS